MMVRSPRLSLTISSVICVRQLGHFILHHHREWVTRTHSHQVTYHYITTVELWVSEYQQPAHQCSPYPTPNQDTEAAHQADTAAGTDLQ